MEAGVPAGGDEHLGVPSHHCSGCFSCYAPAPALQRLQGSVTAPGRGAAQPGQAFARLGQDLGSLQNFLVPGEASLCLKEASTTALAYFKENNNNNNKEKSVF